MNQLMGQLAKGNLSFSWSLGQTHKYKGIKQNVTAWSISNLSQKVRYGWCISHKRTVRWVTRLEFSKWVHQLGLLKPNLDSWTKQGGHLQSWIFKVIPPSQPSLPLHPQNIGARGNVRLGPPTELLKRDPQWTTYNLPPATVPLSFLCPYLVSQEVLCLLLLITSKLRDTSATP